MIQIDFDHIHLSNLSIHPSIHPSGDDSRCKTWRIAHGLWWGTWLYSNGASLKGEGFRLRWIFMELHGWHRSIHKANMDYLHQRCMDWPECGELWDDFLGQYWDYPMIFRHKSQTYRIYILYLHIPIHMLICHSCIKRLVFDSVGEIPRLRMLWQGVLWRRCQRWILRCNDGPWSESQWSPQGVVLFHLFVALLHPYCSNNGEQWSELRIDACNQMMVLVEMKLRPN